VARRVAKQGQLADWQITRIDGKRAFPIGQLQAANAEAAIRLAIEKYDIAPEQQGRIAAGRSLQCNVLPTLS
jgi:hypothetical protein